MKKLDMMQLDDINGGTVLIPHKGLEDRTKSRIDDPELQAEAEKWLEEHGLTK